jgi:hypothetical protein
MRIALERTGGFAGMKIVTALDEASLTPRQALRLHRLLDESRFFELPARLEAQAPRPDLFHYRLTVENENGVRTVQASEETLPPKMRPLVDWILAAAHRKK